ncbi:MAG: RNA pseudouridine synthase [Clostridia bacterium]|nr:RNA pseudouridine synthase [Clostridia bacterium]
MSISDQIIYEDKHIIVLSKLPGQLSQPDKMNQSNLKSELEDYLLTSGQRQKSPFVGVIHRLDRPVGGVMVYGKTKEGTRELNNQLQTDAFKKVYLAVVKGIPTPEQGNLQHYLVKNQKLNLSKVVPENTANSKMASLDYSVIDTKTHPHLGPCSLIKVTLHTGRHHQIRVQFAHVGHPLLGDTKYGEKDGQAIGLWAYQLTLKVPFKDATETFSRLPEDAPFSLFDMAKLR